MIRLVTIKKELLSKELVQLLTNNVVALFSILEEIVSDNYVRITVEAWKEMCKVLEITNSTAVSRYQQANRQTERTVQTVKNYLKAYASKTESN